MPPRAGHRHTMIAPYGMYRMSDGESVMIGVQSNRDWADFAEHVLQDSALVVDPRFVDNSDRIANIDDLEALINSEFASVPAEELIGRLRAGRVAHSFVQDPLALWQHDQLRARGRFMQVTTPTGSAEVYKPPFNLSDMPVPEPSVPDLGEHAPDLVAELEARAAGGQASGL